MIIKCEAILYAKNMFAFEKSHTTRLRAIPEKVDVRFFFLEEDEDDNMI